MSHETFDLIEQLLPLQHQAQVAGERVEAAGGEAGEDAPRELVRADQLQRERRPGGRVRRVPAAHDAAFVYFPRC